MPRRRKVKFCGSKKIMETKATKGVVSICGDKVSDANVYYLGRQSFDGVLVVLCIARDAYSTSHPLR